MFAAATSLRRATVSPPETRALKRAGGAQTARPHSLPAGASIDHAGNADPSACAASFIKSGNAARQFNHTRDVIRQRIGRALLLAINARWVTRDELCREADIDRRTLDNWINGHCDPTGWRLAVVGQVLGDWFWMHVFGGDVGIAMWQRLQERIEAERKKSDLEYAVTEIETRAGR